jgi:hypothetical protein
MSGPITKAFGPQTWIQTPNMSPRSEGPKSSSNPSQAIGAGPGKMVAQDASGLHFGRSTYPRKVNWKIYLLTKDGVKRAQPGCGHTPGVATPVWPPNRPSFGLLTHADSPRSATGCVGTINAQKGSSLVGFGALREESREYAMDHSPLIHLYIEGLPLSFGPHSKELLHSTLEPHSKGLCPTS